MILVDSSVWIAHLRVSNARLRQFLEDGRVWLHPFVIGEVALGSMRQRKVVLSDLANLPQTQVATETEVLQFIERQTLFGRGIGYVDLHLLASVRLTAGATLWTFDRRLRDIADELGLALRDGQAL